MASSHGLLVVVLGDVESLVDDLWYRLDLSVQLLFDGDQIESVVMCDEVDCKTKVTKASGTTDSMQVGLGGLGEVEVDDNIDCLNVYAPSQQVWNKMQVTIKYMQKMT